MKNELNVNAFIRRIVFAVKRIVMSHPGWLVKGLIVVIDLLKDD